MTEVASESLLAWHFLPEHGRLRFGPPTPVVVGETLRVEGPLELCRRGLHWSLRPIDALEYAPGPIACRVRASGSILRGEDKGCSSERTVIAMADASAVLHEFACRQAEAALTRAKVEDARCWAAIEAKRKWLRGEIDDEALESARESALASARESARASARASALASAWASARASAWESARASAWESAWESANEMLDGMLRELLKLDEG